VEIASALKAPNGGFGAPRKDAIALSPPIHRAKPAQDRRLAASGAPPAALRIMRLGVANLTEYPSWPIILSGHTDLFSVNTASGLPKQL